MSEATIPDRFIDPEAATSNPDLIKSDIRDEEYREYDFGGRVYRISQPVALVFRPGGTTHRVVDRYSVVHCVPAPGVNGCVLRWCHREGSEPVVF